MLLISSDGWNVFSEMLVFHLTTFLSCWYWRNCSPSTPSLWIIVEKDMKLLCTNRWWWWVIPFWCHSGKYIVELWSWKSSLCQIGVYLHGDSEELVILRVFHQAFRVVEMVMNLKWDCFLLTVVEKGDLQWVYCGICTVLIQSMVCCGFVC